MLELKRLSTNISQLIRRNKKDLYKLVPDNRVIIKPELDLDLVALPLLDDDFQEFQEEPFYLDRSHIIEESEMEKLGAGQQIVMYCYPGNFMKHLPFVRTGHLAAAPWVPREFGGVTDIAAFPGASGSPIFVDETDQRVQAEQLRQPRGNTKPPIRLIGVHHAGYTLEDLYGLEPLQVTEETPNDDDDDDDDTKLSAKINAAVRAALRHEVIINYGKFLFAHHLLELENVV